MSLLTHTPEGVSFELPIAGPAARFLAWLIDAVIVQAIIAGLGQALSFLIIFDYDRIVGFYIVAAFVVSFGYGIALEWLWKGQTVGKRALRLQVMDESALPLSFNQVFLRNALRPVDSLPALYLLGGVMALLTKKRQRCGDIVARTIVSRREPSRTLDFNKAAQGKFNSMKHHRREAAALRQAVPPSVAGLALQSSLRRDQLDDDARLNVFRQLRHRFEEAATFPEEATVGLSDEQYVRNCVEILYEQRGSLSPRDAR